jgi:hypothetical protein
MPLKVDFSELEFAFDDHDMYVERRWYLDKQTGDVLLVSDDGDDDDALPVPRDVLEEDSERFLAIEPRETRDAYRDMEAFLDTVRDGRLRQSLSHALAGKGPFRAFKDALLDAPSERERWFVFARERMHAYFKEWLAHHGVDAEPR